MSLVACVQITNLPIALAQRDDAALRDRPLVLYATHSGRTVVVAASDETGVTPGSALQRARVRCPQAVCLPAQPKREAQVGAQLAALLGTFSPRVASTGTPPDLALALDLGRATVAQAMALVAQVRTRVRDELGLACAMGVGTTPLVAQLAAQRAGSGAAVLVPAGQERALLAPVPLAALGVEAALAERLQRLGLRTAGDVARVPLDALQAQCGADGRRLYLLVRGQEALPIPTVVDAPALELRRRFAGAVRDRHVLGLAVAQLAERLSARLAAGGWSAGVIGLTLELEDGEPLMLERRLAESTSDGARVTAALTGLFDTATLECGVEAVVARADGLRVEVGRQLELFEPAGGQVTRLQDVIGRLGERFAGSVLRAELAEPGAALPERRVRLERR